MWHKCGTLSAVHNVLALHVTVTHDYSGSAGVRNGPNTINCQHSSTGAYLVSGQEIPDFLDPPVKNEIQNDPAR